MTRLGTGRNTSSSTKTNLEHESVRRGHKSVNSVRKALKRKPISKLKLFKPQWEASDAESVTEGLDDFTERLHRVLDESAKTGVNPKDLIGSKKVPLSIVPYTAIACMAMALMDGATKYGPFNWRDVPVQSHIYVDALLGHAMAASDGQDFTSDSGIWHLAHAMACCGILLDGALTKRLIDTRHTLNKPGAGTFTRDPFQLGCDLDGIAAILTRPFAPTIGKTADKTNIVLTPKRNIPRRTKA